MRTNQRLGLDGRSKMFGFVDDDDDDMDVIKNSQRAIYYSSSSSSLRDEPRGGPRAVSARVYSPPGIV